MVIFSTVFLFCSSLGLVSSGHISFTSSHIPVLTRFFFPIFFRSPLLELDDAAASLSPLLKLLSSSLLSPLRVPELSPLTSSDEHTSFSTLSLLRSFFFLPPLFAFFRRLSSLDKPLSLLFPAFRFRDLAPASLLLSAMLSSLLFLLSVLLLSWSPDPLSLFSLTRSFPPALLFSPPRAHYSLVNPLAITQSIC